MLTYLFQYALYMYWFNCFLLSRYTYVFVYNSFIIVVWHYYYVVCYYIIIINASFKSQKAQGDHSTKYRHTIEMLSLRTLLVPQEKLKIRKRGNFDVYVTML